MKSSSGAHFIALDHVRALAAFLVVCWHFTHGYSGYPIPFEYVPGLFPFALLDEGHTGVALFMTLSGYLFAKLLNGNSIRYLPFLWNRALRLLPLLLVVIVLAGCKAILIEHQGLFSYIAMTVKGVVLPTLPNGGWSITTEFHYYLILPCLLRMFKRAKFLPVFVCIAAIVLRAWLYHGRGEVQSLAYWTILGRIDQFVLGMLAFQSRTYFAVRYVVPLAALTGFAGFYWYFDRLGGFNQLPSYPSPSPLWIFLPTIEGFAYAVGVSWYDNAFSHANNGISRIIGRMGDYSYSIYLLHIFFVFPAASFVNQHIMTITGFYLCCAWALVFYIAMMPIGYLSYRFIEAPFLKLRKSYIVAR